MTGHGRGKRRWGGEDIRFDGLVAALVEHGSGAGKPNALAGAERYSPEGAFEGRESIQI